MNIIEAFYSVFDESIGQETIIRSNLEVLLCHMLKCKYQNDYLIKDSWRKAIKSSFKAIVFEFKGVGKGRLYKNFYMKKLNFDTIYRIAVNEASYETGLDKTVFPDKCEWAKEQLTDVNFIYDFINEWGQDDPNYNSYK